MAIRKTLLALLISNSAFSGTAGPVTLIDDWRIALAVGGGVISSEVGHAQSFPIQNPVVDEFYNYTPQKTTKTKGYFDVFAGVEWDHPKWDLQMGVGVLIPSIYTVEGSLVQGADIQSQDQYNYFYKVQIRQYLAEAKLFYNCKEKYHPYALLGLGFASNKAHDFRTSVPPFLTFTRIYNNHTNTAFSYGLGIGVDVDITQHIRAGLGYRFSDFGKIKFGQAIIDDTPVYGSFSQSNLYSNAALVQITYIN